MPIYFFVRATTTGTNARRLNPRGFICKKENSADSLRHSVEVILYSASNTIQYDMRLFTKGIIKTKLHFPYLQIHLYQHQHYYYYYYYYYCRYYYYHYHSYSLTSFSSTSHCNICYCWSWLRGCFHTKLKDSTDVKMTELISFEYFPIWFLFD